MNRSFTIRLPLFLLLSFFVPVFALDLNIYEENGRIHCGQGTKEIRDSIIVLHLKGNPLEIGYQYGRLLDGEVVAAVRFWSKRLPRFELNSLPEPAAAGLSVSYLKQQILPNLESQIPVEYLTELRGMAFALEKQVNWDELVRLQTVFDLYQFYDCVTVAAREHATRNGGIMVGRNINSMGAGYVDRRKVVTFYEPEKGLALVTIGAPGFCGAVDGMNTNGLVVSFSPLAVPASDSLRAEVAALDGIPVTCLVRQALQYGTSFEKAIKIISEAPRTRCGTMLVADAQNNRMAFVEFSPHAVAVRGADDKTLWATNHYQSPFFTENFFRPLGTSYQRRFYDRDPVVETALAENTGRLDPVTMVRLLRRKNSAAFSQVAYGGEQAIALTSLSTLSSLVFLPDNLAFWVAAPGYLPATENKYTLFSLNNELGLGNTQTLSLESVPANDIVQDESFRAIQYIVAGDILKEQGEYAQAAAQYQRGATALAQAGNKSNSILVLEKKADLEFTSNDYRACQTSYDGLLATVAAQTPTIATREIQTRIFTKQGMLYDALGQRLQAVRCYEKAVAIGDVYNNAWKETARKYLKKPYVKKETRGF